MPDVLTVKPPADLGKAGLDLWHAVAERYDLDPAELEVLHQAAVTSDELARLEAAVHELTVFTTTGSAGQLRAHPLLGEVRNHRLSLARRVTALRLPSLTEEVGLSPASRTAQTAARARWAAPKA